MRNARYAWLLLVCSCGGEAPPPTAPVPAASEVAAPDAPPDDGWKRFAYDDHASVLTPAQPEVIADTDGEGYIATHEGVGYFIACGDVPGEGEDPVAELVAQARATRLHGRTAKAERDVSRDGMRGSYFETTMTTANGAVLTEHDLVMVRGARVCFLSVMAKEGASVSKEAWRYFDSLRMQ